ncbi:zinc-dependent alcohol dehydrogenase [Dictyobacter arantiisoli]|uniref:Dehydrogenase n=1 Tax=Dictyobacter arantiisoli TaxID=2014874 RepID=A0A5A5TBN2_9CHLR|nr:alcohol dehydrogenase catalytic domain-containing protein [Dictyobacter arantiisoli]GCF08891.1 dehydrogenase [Dictyobacter arantiisoli]
MKSVIITKPNWAEVTELERPTIRPDEVLVRARVVGLCESDVALYQGKRAAEYVRYPVTPGHEWSGEVVVVGDLVQQITPGARVVVESLVSCGVCRNCRAGRTNLCEVGYDEIGFTRPGGLAEYVAVPARQVHILPENASFEEAALLELTAVVAHAFQHTAPQPGDIIVIVGDGPISLIAVQMARLYSPKVMIVLGFREERLELARQFGANHAINMSREDSQTIINELTSRHGADLVFEGTGHVQAVEEACFSVKRGGTVLLSSLEASGAPLSVSNDIFILKQLALQAVFGANSAAWSEAVQLFSNGSLQLAPLISHRFSLDDFQDALDTITLRKNRATKVVIVHK